MSTSGSRISARKALRLPFHLCSQSLSTELFQRYQRSEKALCASLAEMYAQGVSTRKVKAINLGAVRSQLLGLYQIGDQQAIGRLDGSLTAFAQRRLDEPFAYLIIDAKYEKVRQVGAVRSSAVLVALGVDCEGGAKYLRWSSPTARAGRHGKTSSSAPGAWSARRRICSCR